MSCADCRTVPSHVTLVAVLVRVATSALVVDLVAALAADVALALEAPVRPLAPTPLPSTTRRTSPAHSRTLSGKLLPIPHKISYQQDTNTIYSALAALNADEEDNKDSAANETASPPAAQSSGEAQS
jgi:hypothetical protein